MCGHISIDVIGHTPKKEENAHRQKDTKRGKQCRYLRNYQQKTYAVCYQAYLALTSAVQGLDRDILDSESGTQERQRQCRRVGECVG